MPVPLERDVQRRVIALYIACGGIVKSFSQGYRPGGRRHATTRQSKGIPDLYVFFPYQQVALWHETKRSGGKQTPEQRAFELLCHECRVPYILGGVDEAIAYCKSLGRIPADYNPQ